jgi:prevent-host-death family protein
MQILLEKVLPFSLVRNKLSDYIDELSSKKYFIISRKNQPKAVLVDLEYFNDLKNK